MSKEIKSFSGIISLNDNYGSGYYKNGECVCVTCTFGNILVPKSGVLLGILPEHCRPSIPLYCRNCFDNQNGYMIVKPNGQVSILGSSGDFNYGSFTLYFPASTGFGKK